MTPQPPVLDLFGVAKVYPGPPPVTALDGVNLTVQAGELVVIVGPSGSGKSTLLNIMGGLDRATAGSVEIAGHDLTELNDKQLATAIESGMEAHGGHLFVWHGVDRSGAED